jgi:hypothetical protein
METTQKLKLYKSKTVKFDVDRYYSSFYFCAYSSQLHKKGLQRDGKNPLQFFMRDITRQKYESLPNGRYYEYNLNSLSAFKNKPCKKYYILDANKSKVFVGFELYEDIPSSAINTDQLYFDVKGGKLNYLKKPKKKSAGAYKQNINKAIGSSPNAHRGKFAEKYIQMILGHKRMNHISHEVYCHAMLILRKCAGLNLIIPHKFKTLLYDIYAQDSKVNKSTAETNFILYVKKAYKRTGKESIYN